MFLGFVKVKVFRDNQLLLCQFFTVREFEVERAGSLPSCAISSSGLSSDIRQASENLIRGTVRPNEKIGEARARGKMEQMTGARKEATFDDPKGRGVSLVASALPSKV